MRGGARPDHSSMPWTRYVVGALSVVNAVMKSANVKTAVKMIQRRRLRMRGMNQHRERHVRRGESRNGEKGKTGDRPSEWRLFILLEEF